MTPLSQESAATEAEILGLPITFDAMNEDTPEDLTEIDMEIHHDAAIQGEAWVIPSLKKLITRFPDFPVVKNYLRVAYLKRGQERHARKVQEEIVKKHPDYLFGKIGAAADLLASAKISEARAMLGQDLDLRKIMPARTLFHASEVKNFYAVAAGIHAAEGNMHKAIGIKSALAKLVPGDEIFGFLDMQIASANLKHWQQRLAADQEREQSVILPPIPQVVTDTEFPVFQNPGISALYEHDFSLPADSIERILALPRQSLVADLTAVLDHATSRSAYLFHYGDPDDVGAYSGLHALHFLADLNATEALPAVLRIMELHPDLLEMWLGVFNYQEVFARIARGQVLRLTQWLKLPGVSSLGRGLIGDALGEIATRHPAERGEVIDCFEEVLEFYLKCAPGDNIVDTSAISGFVCELLSLRAVETSPLIERLWERGYILESYAGNLESILSEIASPPDPRAVVKPYRTIREYYDQYLKPATPSPKPLVDFESLGLPSGDPYDYPEPPIAHAPGRNDPCHCGSGRKFKKCCMPK